MKRIFFISLLALWTLNLAAADDLLHIKRYLGHAQVAQETLDRRDAFYWSVGVHVDGSGSILSASQEFSCGVAQADYRICTYEDGSPVFEDGKYFFNITSRMAGVVTTVYAYEVNTCKFTLIGALFGYKDGQPCETVAPHIMYNRQDGMWYVFAHFQKPHQLCVGKCYRDPRYGYNEIHLNELDYSDITKGDEDNFVYYDAAKKKWVLVYSRSFKTLAKQESRYVDRGYKLVAHHDDFKTLTGINVVKVGGKRYVMAGSMYKPEEDKYRVFDIDDLSYLYDLNLDIPTGGFRGWATVLPVTEGLETKYQLLTFDRANPDPYDNWQYGNMYMYETVERNPGTEFDIVRVDGHRVKADSKELYTPADLHFRRKFSQRMNYCQSLQTGVMDMSCAIFLKNSNMYPVKDKDGDVKYSQQGAGLNVEGKGCVSLLGGSHLPSAEYVIDLKDMTSGEVRYLKIGTMSSDVADIRFTLDSGKLVIMSGTKEILRADASINKVRVLLKDRKAFFIDATAQNQ